MRKNFVDNLRWIAVLWLIPYHAACVFRPSLYRDFFVMAPGGGEAFFNGLVEISRPWFMPLLFVIAGVSAYYALNHRTPGQFLAERVTRLLIPLGLCTLLLSPVQAYIGELTHYQRSTADSYWNSLKTFFTSGYGGFSGGFNYTNFWYIRFLFYFSLLALPLMVWYKRHGEELEALIGKLPLAAVACMFIFPTEGYFWKPSDYSFPEYFAFFLLGFLVLSNEEIQKKLRKWCWLLLAAAILLIFCVSYEDRGMFFTFLYRLRRWMSVLALFGLGARLLNFRCSVTDYLSRSSYSVYLLHQTILVVISYFVVRHFNGSARVSFYLQYLLVVAATLAATFLAYEIIRRIPGLRAMLGYKKPSPKVLTEQEKQG